MPTRTVRAEPCRPRAVLGRAAVFRAMRAALDRVLVAVQRPPRGVGRRSRVHRTGGGPWRALLEEIGAWDPAWTAPGVSPVAVSRRERLPRGRGARGPRRADDAPPIWRALARSGATLVTCPRSNRHTGAGTPPIAAFYASGVRVAVGTDSLASTPDLNVFAELAAMRALAPSVPARRCSTAPRGRGRVRSVSSARLRHDRAGQARAAARRGDSAGHRRCGRISGVRHRAGRSVRWVERMTCRRSLFLNDCAGPHLSLVRPLQPLGVRAAVRAGRRAAGVAAARRSRGRSSAGFSWRWWRRAARRWGSTGSWTRASTR